MPARRRVRGLWSTLRLQCCRQRRHRHRSTRRQQQAEDQIESDRLFRVLRGYDALPKFCRSSWWLPVAPFFSTASRNASLAARRGHDKRQARWPSGLQPVGQTSLISAPLGVLQSGAIDLRRLRGMC